MSLVLLVWLADVSNGLSGIMIFLGMVLGMGSVPFAAFLLTEMRAKIWPAVIMGMFGLFMTLGGVLLPSKQGVYQIMAAYGAVETVQYLQQSDDAKRIAGKSIQAIEKMLDDALKEDKK